MKFKLKVHCTAAAALAGIVSLMLAGCFGKSAEQYLAAAKNALAKKDRNAAVIQLKNALQENSSLAEARFLLGETLLAAGDASGAGIELQKARELGYDNEPLIPLQAKVLLATGTPDKVISEYAGKLVSSAERQSELQTVLAIAYHATNKTEQAKSAVAAALKSNPGNITARLFQIRLHIASAGTAGVVEMLDAVISAAPANSEAWQLKGDVLQVQGKPGDALVAYRESIKRDKANVGAHGAAVWLLLMEKDLPAAEVQLQGLRAALPALPQTKFLTAMVAMEKGDLKVALEQTQQLLKQSPGSVPALQLNGAVAMRQGLMTQAETSFAKALTIAPENVRIRLLLAQAQLRRGDTSKVIKLLQPLVDAVAPPWEATVLMAQALLVSGDVEGAGKYFSKAIKIQPDDARSRTALALAQMDKGRISEGMDELRSVSLADPGVTADLALINFQIRKKDFQAALAAIERLEKKQPEQPAAAYLRGQTHLLIGDREKARGAFDGALKKEPSYFPAAAALAAMDVADGKPELARQRFAKLMASDPADNRPAMALVEVMSRSGSTLEELTETLNKIIRSNPYSVAGRAKLIALQLENKNFKAALASAQQAVNLIPDNPDLLDLLAQAQYLSGDTNQALASYNQMAALRPKSPEPFVSMANIHMLQKDRAAATQDLKRALSVKPDYFPAHRALIDMEVSAGRLGQALSMVRALEKQPGNEALASLLEGDIYASKRQWADAARAYRAALQKQAVPTAAIKLHRALLAAGQGVEAQKMAAQWLQAHADEPSFLYYLGDIAMAKNDYAGAQQRYAAVLKSAPYNPLALNNMAWLLNREKSPQALMYALEANRISPNTPAFLDTLAEVYAGADQVTKAVETQLEAVTRAPDTPELRLRLARYYLLANDRAKAKDQLLQLKSLGEKFSGQADVQALLATL